MTDPKVVATFSNYVQMNSGKGEVLKIEEFDHKLRLAIYDGDNGALLKTVKQDKDGSFSFDGYFSLKNAAGQMGYDDTLDLIRLKKNSGDTWQLSTSLYAGTPLGDGLLEIMPTPGPYSKDIAGDTQPETYIGMIDETNKRSVAIFASADPK